MPPSGSHSDMIKPPWEIVSTDRPYIVYAPGGQRILRAGKIQSIAGTDWDKIPDSAKYNESLICKSGVNITDFHWIRRPGSVRVPLINQAFPAISASNIVSVQPMNLPSGLVFYLDWPSLTKRNIKP